MLWVCPGSATQAPGPGVLRRTCGGSAATESMQQLADGLKLAEVVLDVANIGEELHRGQPCLVGCKPPNARCGGLWMMGVGSAQLGHTLARLAAALRPQEHTERRLSGSVAPACMASRGRAGRARRLSLPKKLFQHSGVAVGPIPPAIALSDLRKAGRRRMSSSANDEMCRP